MDMATCIADMSISMAQTKAMNNVGIAMFKKVMDTDSQMASELIDNMMPASNSASFAGEIGNVLDVRA